MVTSDYVIGPNDSRHEQCRSLHGSTSSSCSAIRYNRNEEGTIHGNCGHHGNYPPDPCRRRGGAIFCGTLHCKVPGVEDVTNKHFTDLKKKYVSQLLTD